MKLWTWAVSAYERPGVEAACLTLQDSFGQNVSFLLWAIWAHPDEATLARARQIARDWDRTLLAPLRGVRRALKGPPFADETLHGEVKAAELKAEKLLLAALEALGAPRKGDDLAALTAASVAWGAGAAAPGQALQRLAGAVSAI